MWTKFNPTRENAADWTQCPVSVVSVSVAITNWFLKSLLSLQDFNQIIFPTHLCCGNRPYIFLSKSRRSTNLKFSRLLDYIARYALLPWFAGLFVTDRLAVAGFMVSTL